MFGYFQDDRHVNLILEVRVCEERSEALTWRVYWALASIIDTSVHNAALLPTPSPFLTPTNTTFHAPRFAHPSQFCSGGELYNRMKRRVKFTNDEAKFYFTEIILALKFLHSEPLSLVYRDLKVRSWEERKTMRNSTAWRGASLAPF